MARSKSPISLKLELDLVAALPALRVTLVNESAQPAAVVVVPRYLLAELRDGVGQFVRGTVGPGGASLPRKGDYRSLAPGDEAIIALPIEARPSAAPPVVSGERDYTIGGHHFEALPARTRVRVTYRADQVMPNLPPALRPHFFAGPADGELDLAF